MIPFSIDFSHIARTFLVWLNSPASKRDDHFIMNLIKYSDNIVISVNWLNLNFNRLKIDITFIQLVKVLHAALGPQIKEYNNIGPAGISSPRANLSIYRVDGGNISNNLSTIQERQYKTFDHDTLLKKICILQYIHIWINTMDYLPPTYGKTITNCA